MSSPLLEQIGNAPSKNTIIPFLFDAAEKKCPIAFQEGSFIWRLLRDDPDRYIYAAVRRGVVDAQGGVIPLPKHIEIGVKDVSKRDGWNKPAAEPFALPTETWREHVARRTRCLELRAKLKAGEVGSIDDLITLNLDLWQFARDAIVDAEGPELLRAFWEAVEGVTVLDPTCGSGAFLFAALRVLETLYSDCLERMERFVEDLAAKPHHPEQFTDFKKVLAQIGKHPNERYFILKSIIISNLFGVDIMAEAVEICKLRLFLKLVAQVEKVEQIEPLPDIDFNIRTGNSLVGYATRQEARKTFTEGAAGQGKLMLGDAEEAYKRFEENAEVVERIFRQFRLQQTVHGGKVTLENKQELRRRLAELDDELDRYLAGDYGINLDKRNDYDQWRASHQPFHWFVEFYGIMRDGGFDVIIGNPPYVELTKVSSDYQVRGLVTQSCGNLYAVCLERCIHVLKQDGLLGLVVQQPATSTLRMKPLRKLLTESFGCVLSSTHDDRPSKLFDGIHHSRIAIIIAERSAAPSTVFVTSYMKWNKEERSFLFARLKYARAASVGSRLDVFPKLGSAIEASLAHKVIEQRMLLGSLVSKQATAFRIYYKITGVGHWFTITTRAPRFMRNGKPSSSSREESISFATVKLRDLAFAVMNSTLFYWFYQLRTNCRDFNPSDFRGFPIPAELAQVSLQNLARKLQARLDESSTFTAMSYKQTGQVEVETFKPRSAKDIVDEIDRVLAKHYGLTDEELDFIINYDIKYRVGAEAEPGED